MVHLVNKVAKLCAKLEENHHHHQNHHAHHLFDEMSPSFLAFQSQISKSVGQIALNLKPGSEILSLSWIEKCFGLLSITNKAFSKLLVDIDYPFSKWEVDSIEGYLNFTLCLLELFNSVSSSLSHLAQARLSISHGLTLLENSNSPYSATRHLKEIRPEKVSHGQSVFLHNKSKFEKASEEFSTKGDDKGRSFSGKELIVHEAVKEMKSIGFWVCGILLSGLNSDGKPYKELKKISGGFDGSSVLVLDSLIREELMDKVPILKEVKEVNDAVAKVLDASSNDKGKELQKKLHVLEKLCDVVKAEVDDLFGKVMKQRTELIDCFRLRKQP